MLSFHTLVLMELFILTALHLLMTVQSYKVPNVKVSPDVVRESNSIHLTCETPADVTVIQCHFYAKEEKNIKVSRSCDLQLTGAEALLWTGEKSPVSLNINCFYTTDVSGIHQPSSHSPPATVTILETLKKPIISVEDRTAQISISCEIPMRVRADFSCNLYTEDGLLRQSYSQRTQSGEHHCTFYLSLSEIFTQKQTESRRQLSCDYSPKTNPDLRSARSDPKTIRGIPQAKLTASSSNIMEKDTVRLICDNNENQKMEMCYFKLEGTENYIKQNKLCELSLTGSDIINWSGGQRSSVIIICYYTVYKTQVAVASPHSDPVTVQILKPATTARTRTTVMKTSLKPVTTARTTTTAMKTFLTPATTARTTKTAMKTSLKPAARTTTTTTMKQTYQEFKIPSAVLFTGAGAFVILLIGLCLCRCANKKRTKSQETAVDTIGSGPAEIYSLITSAPDASQPTGLRHSQSHQDCKPDPSEIYSLITSTSQPSGASVNTQHKQRQAEENKNIYHIYCTIPDKPVNTGNQIYSLAR